MSLTADQLVRLGFQSVAEFAKATAANIAELTGGGATTLHNHGILSRSVHISSAQILALDTMPVELVPTPGPGIAIVVLAVYGKFIPGSTPYTVPNGARLFAFLSADGIDSAVNSGFYLVDLSGTDTTFVNSVMNGQDSLAFNNALMCQVGGGGPGPWTLTGGNSTLDVTTVYVLL